VNFKDLKKIRIRLCHPHWYCHLCKRPISTLPFSHFLLHHITFDFFPCCLSHRILVGRIGMRARRGKKRIGELGKRNWEKTKWETANRKPDSIRTS
jgi:hypothetical protein